MGEEKMENNSENLKEELKNKLMEIFQFESEDLDFGIYRIMNYKRQEIKKFIEEEFIDEIKKQLLSFNEEERNKIEEQLNEISSEDGVKKYLEAVKKGDKKRIEIYIEDFKDKINKYKSLKKQMEEIKFSENLEKEIYNHLINFFSRYYDNGDFISKRRYGNKERYCIPYNGEEITLYWVNKDQYYIKTTEYFKKYTFRAKELTVNFKVAKAEEEKGNAKSSEKKFFVLNEKIFDFDKEKKELDIYFDYRALTDEEKEKYKHGNSVSQKKANEETINILKEKIPKNSLTKPIFEKEKNKRLIEKHLYRYTKRNSTDYFIHKDLKRFLERELDFYIKNEFLQLDDLEILDKSGYFDKLKIYMTAARAFRNIALNIIEFLSQIENFQKRIWEKKKFVIDTNYVITLDKIKEYTKDEFLENIIDEILKNKKQITEWKELFGIEVKKKEDVLESDSNEKQWKKLPIDTKYFDEEFKWKLLVTLSENNDLDEILNGVLVKSENWQALNLLLNKYYEKVQTVYIDPPFNKENEADYLYKVGYKDATWITMLENRIRLGRDLLNERGSIFVRCDYNGNMYVRFLMNKIFGEVNFRNEITIAKSKEFFKTMVHIKKFSAETESLFFFSKTPNPTFNIVYKFKNKPSKYKPFLPVNDKTFQDYRIINGKKYFSPKGRKWGVKQENIEKLLKEKRLVFENGKWYWEVKAAGSGVVGVQHESVNHLNGTNLNDDVGSVAYSTHHGIIFHNNNSDSSPSSDTDGCIIGCAVDMDNNKIYWHKDGTYIDTSGGTQNPTTAANPITVATGTNTSGFWFPKLASGSSSQTYETNFGNPNFSISSGNADANGYGNFEYAVPSGYYSLCTKNLAEFG